MSQGKFSSPRPHREEDRQIEQAFRQVTGKEPAPSPTPEVFLEKTPEDRIQQEMTRQIPPVQPPAAPVTPPIPEAPAPAPVKPRQKSYNLLPEDVDAFFDGTAPELEDPFPMDNEPDFVDKMMDFFSKAADYCRKNQKFVMAGACGGALLLIIAFICIFFAGSADPNEGLILDHVYIADISVGGMTKNEAISAVKQATSGTYAVQDMVIDLSGVELTLSPKDTDAQLDVKAAVNAAYDYGRTGTKAEQENAQNSRDPYIIGLLPYLQLDTDYIKDTLTQYAEDSGSTLTQPSYGLEGKEPELSADKFDEKAPTQTLVITLGTPGVGFDVDDVYDQVLDAYSLHVFLVEVENVESVKDPEPVDLEAIYEEFYIEPVNASVNMQTFKTSPGAYGYGFDLKKAQKLIDQAEFGEEVRIPMEYIAPEILDADSFFRDTLGEYRTRTTGNDNRNKNLELACEAIHDTVLNPGDSLSFSGSLSSVRGFKSAPEDTGREATDRGGVTQVASTLYYAALVSDLEISSRSSLSYLPSFAEPGLDAAEGLKIKNTTGYPIRIEAEVKGGYVQVTIIGTEERDYYLGLDYSITNTYTPTTEYKDFPYDNKEGYKDADVIEEGSAGYQVKTYKVKYDTESGRELSRDFITTSQYPASNRIVARVEPAPTTAPTTEATEPPTEAPTQAPTEAPTEPPKPAETTPPPATEPAPPVTEPPTVPTDPPVTEAPQPPATESPIQEATEPAPMADPDPTVPEEIPAE